MKIMLQLAHDEINWVIKKMARKNFKSVTIPKVAYEEIKTLGESKIFEVPLSVSKTIVWLLEKQKAHHNRKNKMN